MTMRRRDIFAGFLAGTGALIGRARAATEVDASRVVYHLSDFGKVGFVLGNIHHHYEGTGGKVTIELVVHGPALRAFARGTSVAIANRFEGLRRRGLGAHACANTMKGLDITLDDLLPGFASAEQGGVVKLAALQAAGYAYLRP
jgi:intracellular sulfur oxidation DsrE/DsrF family protein